MNFVYGRVAILLNDHENYRTDTEAMDALILKDFTFKFCNSCTRPPAEPRASCCGCVRVPLRCVCCCSPRLLTRCCSPTF